MCYSNYDFAKVRRELDLFSPLGATSSPPSLSAKHQSPPMFNIKDISSRMHGANQPPGLRFPTGGIVGNHFILCGLYLASTSAAFSVYALNLDTLAWRHLEPGILSTGSWNRAVIWADQAKLVVFGNQASDLAADYGRRAVSVEHMAIVSLEPFGIYTPPRLEVPAKIQEAGLTMLDENLASDFEVVCDDGRRIKCSKHLLMERWGWFNQQEQELRAKASGVVSNIPVDINDTLLGAFNPARLESTHLDLPEPFPVCVALVQYFYTLSLSTPLQNRAPVLSALLFLAKQYKIGRLAKLVVHALHERLDNTNAVGVYEIATLTGQQNLQVRALNMIHVSLFLCLKVTTLIASLLKTDRHHETTSKVHHQLMRATTTLKIVLKSPHRRRAFRRHLTPTRQSILPPLPPLARVRTVPNYKRVPNLLRLEWTMKRMLLPCCRLWTSITHLPDIDLSLRPSLDPPRLRTLETATATLAVTTMDSQCHLSQGSPCLLLPLPVPETTRVEAL
jgi:hypothetical protein